MKNRVRKLLLVSVLATGLSVGPVVSRDAHALDLGDIQENPQEYAVYAGLGVLIIVGYTIKKVRDKKKAKKREEKAENFMAEVVSQPITKKSRAWW